jgi:hypothetical protein
MTTTDPNLPPALRELLDREAIRDLAARYIRCMWTQDPKVVELYTADGRFSLRAPDGRYLSHEGSENIERYYRNGFANPDTRAHPYASNHVIELLGPERATGTCHADIRLRRADHHVFYVGYWDDEYARVAGAWKFKSRDFTLRYKIRGELLPD